MRKTANIMLIIGGVLAILGIIGYLISIFVFAGANNPQFIQALRDAIQQQYPDYTAAQIDGVIEQFKQIASIMIVVMIILSVTTVLGGVLAFVTAKVQTQTLYIINIVIGVLSGNIFILLGGIFGLVKDNNQ